MNLGSWSSSSNSLCKVSTLRGKLLSDGSHMFRTRRSRRQSNLSRVHARRIQSHEQINLIVVTFPMPRNPLRLVQALEGRSWTQPLPYGVCRALGSGAAGSPRCGEILQADVPCPMGFAAATGPRGLRPLSGSGTAPGWDGTGLARPCLADEAKSLGFV